MFRIENLKIYTTSLELVVKVYNLIRTNNDLFRDFSLSDQIKRAAVSVSTNISEGYFRSKKQTKNYLEIASGSSNEVVTLLKIISLVYKIDTKNLIDDYQILEKKLMLILPLSNQFNRFN